MAMVRNNASSWCEAGVSSIALVVTGKRTVRAHLRPFGRCATRSGGSRLPSMPERLGKHQRDLLAALAGVRLGLVAGGPLSLSLVRRGLLAAEADGSFAHITPAGLRAVADEIEAGRVEMFSPEKLRKTDG